MSSSEQPKKKATSEPSKKKKKLSKLDAIAEAIAKQFNKAQKSKASHEKCIASLLEIMNDDYEKFLEKFFELVHPVLIVSKSEKSAENIIQLIAKFCAAAKSQELSSESNAAEQGFDFTVDFVDNLIVYANASNKTVRYRVAQITSQIIEKSPMLEEIDEDFVNSIKEKFVPRLRDKLPAVRLMAVSVLAKFQDPHSQCAIMSEFLRMMGSDPNKDVRKETVKRIFLLKQTLGPVVEKVKDIKEEVRGAAYEKIFSTVKMRNFTIQQRVNMINYGLEERDANVKAQFERLFIEKWFTDFKFDISMLLTNLDVIEYETTCEKLIRLILDRSDKIEIVGDKVDFQSLTPELALFWRCKCQYLASKKKEIDDLLPPSITGFVHLVIEYLKQYDEFVVRQLLIISKYLDYSDEVGRSNVHSLLSEMLSSFHDPEAHVKEIIESLKCILPNPEDFQTTILNRIDELRKAALSMSKNRNIQGEHFELQKKERIQQLNLTKQEIIIKIQQLTVEKTNLAQKEEYLAAKEKLDQIYVLYRQLKEIEAEITKRDEVRPDMEEICLWLRALQTTSEFIMQAYLPVDISQFIYLVDDLILIALDHDFDNLRSLAIKTLGQFSSLNIDIAKQHVGRLVTILSQEANDDCINAVLQALFDIFRIHSVPTLLSQQESKKIILKMKDKCSSSSRQVRTTGCEGFARLLLTNTMYEQDSAEILSDLILLLFNEATEKDHRLRQCLTIFFPAYAYKSANNMKTMASIFINTLRRVIHADKKSTLSKINIQILSQYLLDLTNPEKLSDKQKSEIKVDTLCLHENIGIALAYEILLKPTSKESQIYCKLFPSLSIYNTNRYQIKKLIALLERVREKIPNKITQRSLDKYLETVQQNLTKSKEGEEQEGDDETTNLDQKIVEEIELEVSQIEMDLEVFIDALDEKHIEHSRTPNAAKRQERAKNPNQSEIRVNLIEIGEERTKLFSTPTQSKSSRYPTPPTINESPIQGAKAPSPFTPLTPQDEEELDIRATPNRKSISSKQVSSGRKSITQKDMYDSEDTIEELSDGDSILEEKEPQQPRKKISFASPEASSSSSSRPSMNQPPIRKSSTKQLADEISNLLNNAPMSSDDED
ncbi:hypothetical protein C9374_007382 [Naegleria lovaniensis]|uniref:Nuclear condensin complex subunit 3 C-terminal domain-containing protein n=1 Tax=Naegleria lovaniensis TaxID=51637 RepID=A0AA88KIU0_NAELO|nr:uncharacterized protein C9374_007382 [Naegleria lovaniensis]KAG2379243.1 hypothetical protein C9374_007382 [Naegleria lovaniensis]